MSGPHRRAASAEGRIQMGKFPGDTLRRVGVFRGVEASELHQVPVHGRSAKNVRMSCG